MSPGRVEPAPPARDPLDRLPVLLLVAAFLLVLPAGLLGLLEPTETRHAEIAREMLASGDWLTPRLNALAHLDKPPLAYWAAALGLRMSGPNAWGPRVPVALASLVTLAFTVLAARRRFAPLVASPTLPAWLMLGMLLYALAGRAVATDPYLAMCVTGWWALAPSPWALALLGLGFLAKGPVVLVLTLLPALVAAAWGRARAPLALLAPAWGWLVAAAIALPWYVAMAARTPGLAGWWLGHETWARFATTEHGRGGPPWYFLGVLIAGALPWTPALLLGLAHTWRERARDEARLLLVWVLVPLAVFSASGSKLPAYLLPCAPAMALLAARGFERGGRAVRHATGLLLLVLAAALWIAARHGMGRLIGLDPPESFPIPAGLWLAIGALALAAFRVAAGPPARTALLVALGFGAALVALARHDRALGAPRAAVELMGMHRAGQPVVEYRRFVAGVPFQLGETVRLLEVPRETRFDDAATVARVMLPRDSLVPLTDAYGRLWIVGPIAPTESLVTGAGLRWTRIAVWKDLALGFAAR